MATISPIWNNFPQRTEQTSDISWTFLRLFEFGIQWIHLSRRIYILGKIFSTLHRRQSTISCQLPIADSFGLLIVAANYLHCYFDSLLLLLLLFLLLWLVIISYGGQEKGNNTHQVGQKARCPPSLSRPPGSINPRTIIRANIQQRAILTIFSIKPQSNQWTETAKTSLNTGKYQFNNNFKPKEKRAQTTNSKKSINIC